MSKMSKQKGKLGEREVAQLLKDFGYEARRGYQYLGGSQDEPDVKHNIPGIHIEVKRTERLNLPAAFRQAQEDAGDKQPVVFHRASRQPWLVTVEAQEFLKLMAEKDRIRAMFVDLAGRTVNPPVIVKDQPDDSDFERLRSRVIELQNKLSAYKDGCNEYSEKQVDLIRASAGSLGLEGKGAAPSSEEGPRGSGASSTGVDPSAFDVV